MKAGTGYSWKPTKAERLNRSLLSLVNDAERAERIAPEEARELRESLHSHQQSGRRLRTAFGYAIKIGVFAATEADELHDLLGYRNDIAHRIHLMMYDVSRDYWASDHLYFQAPLYKGDALDRLRDYQQSLWQRMPSGMTRMLSMDGLLFETAQQVYEVDLKRLDRLIQTQIRREMDRAKAINAELNLDGTELVDEFHPRHPYNFHSNNREGADSGHLTKRGVEICYRIFDLGKTPIAVAYLMGISLRAAQRRQQSWLKEGGACRSKVELERFD